MIKTKEELIATIMNAYEQESVELSEAYFEGVSIEMSKKDLLEAYAEIQMRCNGDTVVRLKKLIDKNEGLTDEEIDEICETELVPDGWNDIIVCGDACDILSDFTNPIHGGYKFARVSDDCLPDRYCLLNLLFGMLNIYYYISEACHRDYYYNNNGDECCNVDHEITIGLTTHEKDWMQDNDQGTEWWGQTFKDINELKSELVNHHKAKIKFSDDIISDENKNYILN